MKKIISILTCILIIFSSFAVTSSAEEREKGYENMTGFKEAANSFLHKKEILNEKYIGEKTTDKWTETDKYNLDDTVIVTKEKGKDFVILNITDIHFSDFDYRFWTAFSASRTVKTLVKKIKPNLITVSGDIVCGSSTVYSIKRFTDLMNSFEIPWAPVFGNHDNEANCDHNYLADIMMKSPYCLFKKGDSELGCGNYIVNIAEKEPDGKLNIVHSFIMMDTHGSHLNEKQIKWYKFAANGICDVTKKQVPSSVIFHIPCVQYQYAYDESFDKDKNKWKNPSNSFGELHEKICCPRDADGNPVDNGFFDAVLETGNTKNILCGHEHLNNFSVLYKDIRLTYMLKVGKGSGFLPKFNGGTKITVDDKSIKEIKHIYISQLGF